MIALNPGTAGHHNKLKAYKLREDHCKSSQQKDFF